MHFLYFQNNLRVLLQPIEIDYEPDGKPKLSYADLIRRAIQSSSENRMTLSEIYQWIQENFTYYQKQNERQSSWKNSIRHNLSLNKMFVKEERAQGERGSRGNYWRIDDNARESRHHGGAQSHSHDGDEANDGSATSSRKRARMSPRRHGE